MCSNITETYKLKDVSYSMKDDCDDNIHESIWSGKL